MDSNIITLNKLYETDFELTDIFAMRQKWKYGVLFKRDGPRKTTGIIFLNKCRGVYTDKSGVSFEAKEKSIVCLPKGSEYTCLNLDCTATTDDAIWIEFNMTKDNRTLTLGEAPFLIENVKISPAKELFDKVLQACEASVRSPMEIKKAAFELLLLITNTKTQKRQERFSVISRGIELIEADPLADLSIEEIARVCNVTPCYFRRLFKEYASKTPLEYRMEHKMNMAKRMLESGEYSLEQISEAINFESASYFCRIFKKRFGMTPMQYKKAQTLDFKDR